MATPSAFDAGAVLRNALPKDLNLDADAKQRISDLIAEAAPLLQKEPERVAEAQESMLLLAESLRGEKEYVTTPITPDRIAAALSHLCPMFPICV